jgi:hypothetical protein
MFNDFNSLLLSFSCRRHAALEKGNVMTIARSEQSHRAAIRAEPVEMLMLSVKSGRQKPINRKSQNVFDFIDSMIKFFVLDGLLR